MEKKFRILRLIGTIWKILAWIVLIVGLVSSVGVLLASVFGGGIMGRFGLRPEQMPWWPPRTLGLAGGVAAFIASLIATVLYFLLLYAIGELIYLLLAIEENTRLAAQLIQARPVPASYPVAPPAYVPPLSPASEPPAPPD